MPLDPDTLRLAAHMMDSALHLRYGQVVLEITSRFLVDVRQGKCVDASVKELLPRVTIEQLRKAESVIA